MDSYLDRPSARIAYSTSGPEDAGPALLVAHSLATSRQWEDEAAVFDWTPVTAAGSRLVRYDTRGHGESTGEPDPEQYRWSFLAGDLLALAAEVSADRPVDALGESTGCGVVVRAALQAPDRFRRLVLAAPPTSFESRAAQAELYLAAAEMIELRGVEAWQRLVSVAPPAPILREGGWTRSPHVAVRDRLVPSVLRGAAASTFPDGAALAAVTQPTLILAWETDFSHPLETAEFLAEHLPNAVLEVARTPDDIRGWGSRAAEFLAA
ncbi:MAG: alpha/beta fold hydrolase [Amnibacterium sp.]